MCLLQYYHFSDEGSLTYLPIYLAQSVCLSLSLSRSHSVSLSILLALSLCLSLSFSVSVCLSISLVLYHCRTVSLPLLLALSLSVFLSLAFNSIKKSFICVENKQRRWIIRSNYKTFSLSLPQGVSNLTRLIDEMRMAFQKVTPIYARILPASRDGDPVPSPGQQGPSVPSVLEHGFGLLSYFYAWMVYSIDFLLLAPSIY